MQKILRCFIYVCLIWAAVAEAGGSVVKASHSKATLSREVTVVQPGDRFWLAFEIKMKKHWHTYWKNPGEAGAPPHFQFSSLRDYQFGETHYLPPTLIPFGTVSSYGYYDHATYFIPVDVAKNALPGKEQIHLHAEWLVCEEDCIPQSGDFSIPMTIGKVTQFNDNKAGVFLALQQMPQPAFSQAKLVRSENQLKVILKKSPDEKWVNGYFFPIDENKIQESSAQQFQDFGAIAEWILSPLPNSTYQAIKGLVRYQANGQWHYRRVEGKESAFSFNIPLWQAILFALLGGIILNIMPCVFPILSIKILSIVKSSQESYQKQVMHALSYLLGIMLTFVLLVGLMLWLRSLGSAIGWGYQLQSPIIVIMLAYLFFLVGFNLSGYFEIDGSFMGVGSSLTQSHSFAGSFFTGVLAVVVASPCTVPFMATALGFAFTQPASISISIFLFLGLGLALPILLISLIPQLGRYFPKPGQWMVTFKKVLAIPMYLSVVWLLWVLMQQTSMKHLLIVCLGLIVLAGGVLLVRRLRKKWVAFSVMGLAFLMAFYPLLWQGESSYSALAPHEKIAEPFTPTRLNTLLWQKQAVFVNATAAWCLTCKFNEINVLNSDAFNTFIKDQHIHYLIADWTNKSKDITEFLEKQGRSGVPLYVAYTKEGKVTVLPPLLSMKNIRDAFKG